jgi:hypothetical protein
MRKIVLVLALLGFSASSWAADPFVGTWKLNVTKSKVPAPVPKSQTFKCEARGDTFTWTFDTVGADGKVMHSEWSGKYDGKDYPVKGDPTVDTTSLKKTDAYSFVDIDKKAGKEVGRYQVTVSKDGKTMTGAGKVKDEKGKEITVVIVADKQ